MVGSEGVIHFGGHTDCLILFTASTNITRFQIWFFPDNWNEHLVEVHRTSCPLDRCNTACLEFIASGKGRGSLRQGPIEPRGWPDVELVWKTTPNETYWIRLGMDDDDGYYRISSAISLKALGLAASTVSLLLLLLVLVLIRT